ncbi:MAG: hypothetical protein IBX56_08275 [Methylomicrobium sp.]|nr:hypothetical protein [Methylomicrobium sp.]
MNEEFLVEPTGFSSALELKYLLEKFGFYQGRFVGQFPKSWRKDVFEHMGSLPDIEQARIRSLMEQHKNCLVPSGQGFLPNISWLENAHQQIEQNNFDGVIAASRNAWNYPTVDSVEMDYLRGGHDIRVLASSANYTNYTRRLLQLSHEIVLVDPYLQLYSDRCAQVLKNILAVAQQGKCRSVVIWARYEKACMKTKQAYAQMLKKCYQSMLLPASTLIVKLVKDEHSSEKIHARLMLSTLGGFRFDHGFSEFDENRYVDIAILSKSVHEQHCCWYLDPNSVCDFDIVEEHTIKN